MGEVKVELWKQANEIYTQLLDLTVSDAMSQLQSMPNLSDEVKSLVLALISSGNESSQFFKQHVGSSFEQHGFEGEMLSSGDELGEYQIIAELGHGGMASVYHAQRKGAEKQKPVAIKLFNRTQLTPILLNRFAVEQDILSDLSHPNIVNMHHGGSAQSGAPFIVMDLIEDACDIDDYCRSKGIGIRAKVKFIVAAAHAIAYAHKNLIVHRDIKPSNLLIDANRQLKVVDFGIAKLLGQQDTPQKTTILALTPSFAAPEQINSGNIDVTTDVFSLAAVLLSLLIDGLPLPKDRLVKSCVGDEAHIWQLLRSRIKDRDLRNILNQALQQDSSKRYRNMDLFAEDLTAWLARKPVQATPDSWSYRILKFSQRRRALFTALSTLFVMSILGLVLISWQIKKTQAAANNANEVKDFMLGVFSAVDPDEAQGEKILAKDLLSQAFAEIQARDFENIETKIDLLNAMGQAQLQLGLNRAASESFSEALTTNPESVDALLGNLKIKVNEDDFSSAINQVNQLDLLLDKTSVHRADLLLLESQIAIDHNKDYIQAEQQALKAQQIFTAEQDRTGYFSAVRQLAKIQFVQSQSTAAASYLSEQLAVAVQEMAPTNTVVMSMKNDLVELYNDVGEYKQALNYSLQLSEDINRILGDEHPFLIEVYISQAGTFRAIGDLKAARSNAEEARKLSVQLNGENHVSTARAINLMGVIDYVEGDIEAALKKIQHATSIYNMVLGADHPDSWEIKTNVTALLNIVGRYDEAIEIIEPVFRKQTDVLGVGHKSTIYSQTVLARLYAGTGRLDDAESLGENMLKNAIEYLGMDHPLTAGGHFSLAQIYQQTEKYSQAILLITTVINDESWSDKNERAIGTYNTLGNLYLSNHDIESAVSYKEKSLAVAVDILSEDASRTWVQMLNNLEFYLDIKDSGKVSEYIEKIAVVLDRNETDDAALLRRFEQLKTGSRITDQ